MRTAGGWRWHARVWLALSISVWACGLEAAHAAKDLGEEELLGEPLRVSMEFKDANLKNVLKTFSQQTGLNVIASEEVGDKTLTLYLEDVTVMDALDQILQAAGLISERPPGSQIYIVKPKPQAPAEPAVATVTRVYRLKFARVSTSRLARAAEALGSQTPFEAAQVTRAAIGGGTAGGGAAGGGAAGGGTGVTGGGAALEDVGIDKVVERVLTDVGKVTVDERTNSLVVTDVPDNFPRIEAVLKTLDIRTAQILIEVEILETSLASIKDLGIEWGTGSEGQLATLTPGSRTTRFPFGWIGHGDAPSGPTNFSTSTLSATSFAGSLQALAKDTDTKILARPKVLTLDNESAVIRLSSNQAVGFQQQTTATEGQSTTTAQAERLITGVILVVTPQLNEGGYITMLVEPSVTKVSTSTLTPPTALGSAVLDPKTRSTRAMVRIKQGDTLVLGGLIDRSEEEVQQKVPLLGDLPLVGRMFKNTETSNSASELIVFISPRVLEEATDAQLAAVQTPPLGPREQESSDSRQEIIERQLDTLERQEGL